MNIQFAIKGEQVYVLEVNPRASRTVPFVSKAIGVPLAKLAAKVMVGKKLNELGFTVEKIPDHFSVKAPVFPFVKFPGIDIILGPEMRSTGEVMGIDEDFGQAFAKALDGASNTLPTSGRVFISVKDADKRDVIFISKKLADLHFEIIATEGTYKILKTNGIPVSRVNKIHEGRPHVIDVIKNRGVDLIINTPLGKLQRTDDTVIRSHAVAYGIPCITTLSGASAAVNGIEARLKKAYKVQALQDYFS